MVRRGLPGDCLFRPSDVQLLQFLCFFLIGKPVDSTVPIPEKDLYDGIEPWELFETSKENILYFFTRLKKRRPGNARYSRRIGDEDEMGTWKAQDRGKPIYMSGSVPELIGYKRSLRYENKELKEHDGKYIMKEYYLSDKIRAKLQAPLKDYVLCRIKHKQENEVSVFENQRREAGDIRDIIYKSPQPIVPELEHMAAELQPSFDNLQHRDEGRGGDIEQWPSLKLWPTADREYTASSKWIEYVKSSRSTQI
ncbi:unnamed protein product [Cuscuta epithymum]|uniref:NAC domain-containing protein n=1 Tax=Cuscuta epithymum TaxID=186058 RepID=A0AAV0G7M4_9ASTE|nr:unnamed protein product [Cuscuta epithymum]